MRTGRFFISRGLIERKDPLIEAIMAKCVVVRAETLYRRDVIDYIALSDEFDFIEEGHEAPYYEWKMKDGNATAIKIK